MKKLIISIATFATSFLWADHSFGHVDVGFGPLPLPGPELSVGWRCQSGHQGWDTSIGAGSVVFVSHMALRGACLYYPQSSVDPQVYLGMGGATTLSWWHASQTRPIEKWSVAPQWIIGQQRRTKSEFLRMTQLRISWPIFCFGEEAFWVPMTTLSFGYSF